MTKAQSANCPICGHWGADGTPVSPSEPGPMDCEQCGNFSMTQGAVLRLSRIGKRRLLFLSAAARQASEAGRPLSITRDNIEEFIELHESITKTEKIDKLLRYIAHKSLTPGAACEITPDNDYPLVDAENPGELSAYLSYIQTRGLMVTPGVGSGGLLSCQLTIEGWERAEPPVGPLGIPGRCFVAMPFSMAAVFDEAISPAVSATGYDPIFMKEVKTPEEITARIMAEIRKAQFVVAEVTSQNQGIYFEAGFAKALGRKVLWTCNRADFRNVHFDTKHFGHIIWDEPADLRTNLKDSILAEFGQGPHKSTNPT